MSEKAFGILKLPLIVGAAAVTFGMGLGEASAASVSVQNADFEAVSLGDGGFSHDIPGWSVYNGEAGTFNPTAAAVGAVPSGSNVAVGGGSANGFTSIQQNLAEVIATGSQYQMAVGLGLRADGPFQAEQFVVGLYAFDGVTSYELGQIDWSEVSLTNGAFTTVMVDTGVIGSAYAGMNLRIELTTFGFNGNEQVLYDNIRIESGSGGLVVPVHAPTPTTAAAGMALMGGLFARRRRNQQA